MSNEPPPDNEESLLEEIEDDESEEVHARDLWAIGRFLRPFTQPYRRPLVLLALVLLIETVINFSFPLATQYLIDKGLGAEDGTKDLVALTNVLIYLVGAAASITVLGIGLDYLNACIFPAMVADIRHRLFEHVQTLSMSYFTRTKAGVVLSRFSGDMVAVEGTLVTVVPYCMVPLLEVFYSVIVMFYFSPWLGLLGAVVFPLSYLGPRFFTAWAFALTYDKRRREADVLGAAQENISAQTVVKAFGLQPMARARFRALNLLWLGVAFRVHFLGAMVERSSHTGVYFLHIVIFGLGAYWVFIGDLTLGTLVAFEATFLSMGYALTEVNHYVPTLAQAVGSIHHLNDLFNERPQIVDASSATELPRLQSEIAFDNVSFGYAEGAFQLQNLNVRIPKGSLIAFVGASGSGKSTVLNLLLRLYDPTQGTLRIDGRDTRTVTQESLRGQIGIVFQDCFLFNTSILENIRMGHPDATPEQVGAAARAAEIHDFITTLPQGYDTMVGERGSQLSGGQRQRLAIARALVRDPAVLVLDEATSALDYTTEAAINETLLKVAQNRTVIMVTHRLSTVVSAAHIVVLDEGRMVASGTHEKLLNENGAYAALWRTQVQHQEAEPGAEPQEPTKARRRGKRR